MLYIYVVYVILENVVIVNINYLERCSMPPMLCFSMQAIISRYESLSHKHTHTRERAYTQTMTDSLIVLSVFAFLLSFEVLHIIFLQMKS